MNEHQEFEAGWWGNCCSTYIEETKQLIYAQRMGLSTCDYKGYFPVYDLRYKSVLDIGGGPVSMLLKTIKGSRLTIIDPCQYPDWVKERYSSHHIHLIRKPAEEYVALDPFDECWIYNVLQHVEDPEKIISNAKRYAKRLRIFEWINFPPHLGHPQMLTSTNLDKWCGGVGMVEELNVNSCVGTAYYGIFE